MTEQVSLQLPTDMLMQLGVQVFEQAVKTAEQNIIYSHQFVQMYRTKSTPDDQLTLKDFNTYWRTRVEAEPGLTIKKGESQRLYHGFKIAKYIEEHVDEVMV